MLIDMKDSKFLNQRSDKFTIVLNDNGFDCFKNSNYIVRCLRCCDLLCCLYIACIKHDKDFDEETQHLKTVHYHLILCFDRVYRIGTMINLLQDLFKCNANQITIDKCTSLLMQSRYLIHLDELPNEKVHYNEQDVVTYDNHNSREQFENYIKQNIKINTVNDIIALIQEFPRLDTLIARIGLENYKKWRVVIQDLRRELILQRY